jgi:putative flippase GtrA
MARSAPLSPFDLRDRALLLRFLANGLVAAAIHFLILFLLIKKADLASAGVANLLAAVCGVSASFLGNRHFVFRASARPVLGQASRFLALYAVTALMHGLVLFGWTDIAGRDYRVGFLIATGLQVIISFLGNRLFVFSD